MKKQNLIRLILIIFSLYISGQLVAQSPGNASGKEPKIKWYSFEEAYNLNKKKPKKMVVDIFTEWCGWCKKMDAETFTNPAIVKYMNAHFYCVKFDAERKDTIILDGVKFVNLNPGNKRSTHQLANQLLRNSMSYPSYSFLNEKGQSIIVIPGYHGAKEFEAILSFFGEDAYLKSKPEEFQKNFDEYLSTFHGEVK